MRLNELRDNPNARKSRTRIGRGIGSGKGKLLEGDIRDKNLGQGLL